MRMDFMTMQRRRQLAACFPGAFLLQRRCRCTIHVFGASPDAEVIAEACPRCRRYAWYQARQGRTARG